MTEYTEKYCTQTPLAGPAAEHFIGLCAALSGQLSLLSFEKLPAEVQAGILDDISQLSSEGDPQSFMLQAIDDPAVLTLLSPASSRYARATFFADDEKAMEDYQDNAAFSVIRDRDQLLITHVDGCSVSQNIPPIMALTLERYAPDEVVAIRYSMDSVDVRTDSFGGGAVAISRDGSRALSSLDAIAFAKLMLVGDEKAEKESQYPDQCKLVNRLLEGLSAEEQQRLLGTLVNVVKDLEPVVAERLEHERDMQSTDFAPR